MRAVTTISLLILSSIIYGQSSLKLTTSENKENANTYLLIKEQEKIIDTIIKFSNQTILIDHLFLSDKEVCYISEGKYGQINYTVAILNKEKNWRTKSKYSIGLNFEKSGGYYKIPPPKITYRIFAKDKIETNTNGSLGFVDLEYLDSIGLSIHPN